MEIEVKDLTGATVGKVQLPADIFEAPISQDLMHQALVRQMANARVGTHQTKGRGEVRGGGRKPYRQKGTGRARHGSTRAPQWKGGGKVHTPRFRDHSLTMPRQMRRGALRSALSVKAGEGRIVVVENLALDSAAPKTAVLARALTAIGAQRSALVLLPEKNDLVQRSARNLPAAKTLHARYLNVRDVLGYDTLVMPLAALEVIKSYLGQESGS